MLFTITVYKHGLETWHYPGAKREEEMGICWRHCPIAEIPVPEANILINGFIGYKHCLVSPEANIILDVFIRW